MRNTMGRFIAGLDAEGRDRLIAAPEFTDGYWWQDGCGCLVGTVLGKRSAQRLMHSSLYDDEEFLSWAEQSAAMRYPFAVARFGKHRVVRAIKLRAARLNNSDAQTIAALLAQPQSENVPA